MRDRIVQKYLKGIFASDAKLLFSEMCGTECNLLLVTANKLKYGKNLVVICISEYSCSRSVLLEISIKKFCCLATSYLTYFQFLF